MERTKRWLLDSVIYSQICVENIIKYQNISQVYVEL